MDVDVLKTQRKQIDREERKRLRERQRIKS